MTLRELVVAFGFEIDTASERKTEKSIRWIKNLANNLLSSVEIRYDVDDTSERKAEKSIQKVSELAENGLDSMEVKYEVDTASKEQVEKSIKEVKDLAKESSSTIETTYEVDTVNEQAVKKSIKEVKDLAKESSETVTITEKVDTIVEKKTKKRAKNTKNISKEGSDTIGIAYEVDSNSEKKVKDSIKKIKKIAKESLNPLEVTYQENVIGEKELKDSIKKAEDLAKESINIVETKHEVDSVSEQVVEKSIKEIKKLTEENLNSVEVGFEVDVFGKKKAEDSIKKMDNLIEDTIEPVEIAYEVDKSSEREVEDSIRGIRSLANKLLGSVKIIFSIVGITNFAQAAADAGALDSQFAQVFGDMEDKATESLQEITDDTGSLVNRMKGSFTQLASFTKTTGASEAEALALAERGMKAAADSSAFYDRSLEDVTESLQSFLKGNYENDSALGLSCTEITRNTAANKLYGKSFQELSEYQKQLTLLQMVEDANKLSGALGQAARESDTWSNWLGNMQQAVQDLKATVGSTFLQPAILGLKFATKGIQKVTNAIKQLNSENGILTKGLERGHALVKRVQPSVERMAQTLQKGFVKGKEVVNDMTNKLGGTKNAIKLLIMLVTAFVIAMNWKKITKGAEDFVKLLSSIGKLFSLSNAKILLIVAGIALLALLIEDFIHFLLGNDSVIGSFFDKAGIGAENVGKKILHVLQSIKLFFVNTLQTLRKAIEEHGGSIRQSIDKIFGGLFAIASTIFRKLLRIASAIFSNLEGVFENADLSTPINAIVSTIDVLLGILGELGEFISNHSELVGILVEAYAAFKLGSTIKQLYSLAKAFAITKTAKIADKAETVAIMGLYAKDFVKSLATSTVALAKQAGQFAINTAAKTADVIAQGAMTASTVAWNVTAGIATATTTALGAAISFLTSPIGIAIIAIAGLIAIGVLLYKNWDAIKEYAISIWKTIVDVFHSAWEKIQGFFSNTGEFFKGIFHSIADVFTDIGVVISDAISGTVKGAINKVLGGAASVINGFISAINFAVGIINKIPGVEISKVEKLEVPQLAEGGIATRATSAIIGEGAEPEAVLPLSKLGSMISGYIKQAKESDTGKMVSSAITYVTDKISTGISTLKSFVGNLKTKEESENEDLDKQNPDTPNTNTSTVILPKPQIIEKGMQLSELGKMFGSYMKELKNSDTGKEVSIMLKGAMKEFVVNASAFTKATIASPKTASVSTTNNQSSSVVQNVEINNSYTGVDRETTKTVSKAMKKSAVDATTQMARSLAYARG